ncbi:BMA-MDL-1, isoform a [Aphelenchoides bicaudatus]|nr:BMA-MDL-1, isoform a [Aphelenchoides bicaudatus]
MSSAMSLTIDQLLRAAQMLEQQKQIQSLLGDPLSFKLGQNYENHFMQGKIRPDLPATTASLGLSNSTGSSPFSSSPNSPHNGQISRGSAKSSTSSVAPLLTGRMSTSTTSSTVSHSTRQSRAAHNELEKNRRANLRSYLDTLKAVLPADSESSRDTTLSLLTRSRNYIKLVKQQKQALLIAKQEALAEQARLQARLEALSQQQPIVQQIIVEEQQVVEEPIVSQPLQLPNLQSLQQLVKPEPQHAEQQFLEFSPSAKPSTASLDTTLSALLNLNALQAALNQATTPVQPTPISSVESTAALLNSVLSNSLCLPAITQPVCQPFRDLLTQEGLIPRLPLLYPYNN